MRRTRFAPTRGDPGEQLRRTSERWTGATERVSPEPTLGRAAGTAEGTIATAIGTTTVNLTACGGKVFVARTATPRFAIGGCVAGLIRGQETSVKMLELIGARRSRTHRSVDLLRFDSWQAWVAGAVAVVVIVGLAALVG